MTRRRREPSAEEKALFHAAFEDARPTKTSPARSHNPLKAKADGLSEEVLFSTAQRSRTVFPGLDGRTSERLRRGALDPEARLDLHGLTETIAHTALVTFVRTAHARGMRLVLVVTGKGAEPPAADKPFDLALEGRARGVLKAMAPRWLREPSLAPLIAELRTAHRKHGGAGALYVYLRKKSGP
jgi:DNA-nicking Smr family endonuclease